jgi:CRP/FNR family transcriptional regulator, cyclic AMP receptor protein
MYSSSDDPYRSNPVGRDARLAGYAPLVRNKAPRLTRADRRDLLEQLSSYPVLSECDREDLAALIKASGHCSLPPGWAMIAEGTPADFCYVILRGTAAVYRGDDQVAELGTGSLVGEMAVLTGELRSATVTTVTRVAALAIENSVLTALMQRRAGLGRALRRQYAERSASTVRRFDATTLPRGLVAPRPNAPAPTAARQAR